MSPDQLFFSLGTFFVFSREQGINDVLLVFPCTKNTSDVLRVLQKIFLAKHIRKNHSCKRMYLQKNDIMLRAFLTHLARPDACLDFADVGPVQKQHTEAGLADTAADGQRKFAV